MTHGKATQQLFWFQRLSLRPHPAPAPQQAQLLHQHPADYMDGPISGWAAPKPTPSTEGGSRLLRLADLAALLAAAADTSPTPSSWFGSSDDTQELGAACRKVPQQVQALRDPQHPAQSDPAPTTVSMQSKPPQEQHGWVSGPWPISGGWR